MIDEGTPPSMLNSIDPYAEAGFLIVDDEPGNIRVLEHLLQHSGATRVTSLTDPRGIFAAIADTKPDLILLDLQMPYYLDGFEVLKMLEPELKGGNFLPVLALSDDAHPETRRRALGLGASDFITKPIDRTEMLLRIGNLLELHFLHQQLQQHNHRLEAQVRRRTDELEQARMEILIRLARAAEYRDDDTGQHTRRVGANAALMARAVGLSEEESENLRQAAPLHDVGKIGISDLILLKPSKLTPDEFDTVKTHTVIGAQILSGSTIPVLKVGEMIARSHHERLNGSGYPDGLRGDAVPTVAQIVQVADIFDALTHARPYKRAWTLEEAVEEIRRLADTHCDPEIIKAFITLAECGQLQI